MRYLPVTRRLYLAAACAVAIVVAVVAGATISSRSSGDSAVAAALKWARLAPLPASAHSRAIETKGSMFTREFVITFVAPPDDVRQWLDASPGPSSATRSVLGTVIIYSITPGGGAQFAEVRHNEATGEVTIRAYWS
jgi:hypothetical protein